MAMFRYALFAAILSLGGMVADVTSGAMIGFNAQLQTEQDLFWISNTSDPGSTITDLQVFLGDDAEFDTSVLSLGTLTDSGGDLMISPDLSTALVDGASTATFSFTGFDAGDVFEFSVRFLDGGGDVAAGTDLDNAFLAVTFSNGQSLQTTFSGGPTSPPTSDRQAFPFSTSATADEDPGFPGTEVPEPSSALLLMLGIAGFGLIRGGTRFKQGFGGF